MGVSIVKRTHPLTKRLYIEELERPLAAEINGPVTTLASGEESDKGDMKVTTLAVGEESSAS